MKEKKQMPTREMLDEAFHMLQDAINRITVEEDAEVLKTERKRKRT